MAQNNPSDFSCRRAARPHLAICAGFLVIGFASPNRMRVSGEAVTDSVRLIGADQEQGGLGFGMFP